MLSKLGFLILFVAFGLLALLAGVAMPPALLQKIPLPEAIQAWLPRSSPIAAAAPGTGATTAKATEGTATDKPTKEPPPLESLLIPTPTPPQGRYGLQMGIFPGADEADLLATRINALRLPGAAAKTIQSRGRDGQNWWVVAAGDQASPQDLEMTRAWLAERLSAQAIRPILLPAPAKP